MSSSSPSKASLSGSLFSALRRSSDDLTGRKNLQLLIQLRWIAMFGQFATILVVNYGFGIKLPVSQMLVVLFGLLLLNAVSVLRLRLPKPIGNTELFLSLLIDVATLTMLLALSGGASNPFVFLYLLQVILGAVLLEVWSTWVILITHHPVFWLAGLVRPSATHAAGSLRGAVQSLHRRDDDLLCAQWRLAGDLH